MNVAHAPIMTPVNAVDKCSARALGIFDVSTDPGAAALVSLLSHHRLALTSCAAKAQVHAQCAKRTLLSDRVQPWQVDLIASLGPDDCKLSPESRVHRWISAQGSALIHTPGMMCSTHSVCSKAEPVVSATGPPPRSVQGLGRSSLGDKYGLRSELNLHFNDFWCVHTT